MTCECYKNNHEKHHEQYDTLPRYKDINNNTTYGSNSTTLKNRKTPDCLSATAQTSRNIRGGSEPVILNNRSVTGGRNTQTDYIIESAGKADDLSKQTSIYSVLHRKKQDNSQSFNLTVWKTLLTFYCVVLLAASPLTQTKVKGLKVGEKIRLNCFPDKGAEISGRHFEWLLNGTLLVPDNSGRIQFRRSGTVLKMKDATERDVGEYACQEDLGKHKIEIIVYQVKFGKSLFSIIADFVANFHFNFIW